MSRPALRFVASSILTTFVCICSAQQEVGHGITAAATITNQRYCVGEPMDSSLLRRLPADAITLRLMVLVTYRNTDAAPQIFQAAPNETIVISRSVEDASQRRNQALIQWGYPRSPFQLADRDQLESDEPRRPPFIFLSPGGTWAVAYEIGVQVHNPAERSRNMELLGKKIFFQMDLNHAMLPNEIVRDLQVKWRSYGSLWAARVRTQPIEVDIPRSPETSKCASEID